MNFREFLTVVVKGFNVVTVEVTAIIIMIVAVVLIIVVVLVILTGNG